MISVGSKTDWAEELVTRSRQGDRDAFGDLVRTYQDRLFNSILRVVASRTDAEDLVQEAFVQAYLNLASFRGNCSFYTWLYRIALNLAYSSARRRQVRKALERTREVSDDIPADSTTSPSERIERAEEWLCLVKTREDLYGAVEGALRAHHSYETPEIVSSLCRTTQSARVRSSMGEVVPSSLHIPIT